MSTFYIIVITISIISFMMLFTTLEFHKKLALVITIFLKTGLVYTILNQKFLGLTYIIVYVGAIAILFLFGIKMTSFGRSPKFNNGGYIEVLATGKTKLSFIIIWYFYPKNFENILSYNDLSHMEIFFAIPDIQVLGFMIYHEYPIFII